MKVQLAFCLFIVVCAASRAAATNAESGSSCQGRCGDKNGSGGCSCDTECKSHGNCCEDYSSICYSCQDRCNEKYLSSKPCQCNNDCRDYFNCCQDFTSVCSESGEVTDQDIMNLTEELYKLDQSLLVGNLITYDTYPPGPLFTKVDPEALNGPTISTFLPLRDNYYPLSSKAEYDDSQEEAEKKAFLDAVMATDVMKTTEQFMTDNQMITKPLRDVIDEIFFTRYPRYGNVIGSSGFEHSFMGEIDDGQVKGFHNWISFYEDEQNGELEYTSYKDEEDIGKDDLDLYMMGFKWYGYNKPISSMFIGSTPELELALYTLCFYHQPNKRCQVSMNGVKMYIQTYTTYYNGGTYVGSAYPDI